MTGRLFQNAAVIGDRNNLACHQEFSAAQSNRKGHRPVPHAWCCPFISCGGSNLSVSHGAVALSRDDNAPDHDGHHLEALSQHPQRKSGRSCEHAPAEGQGDRRRELTAAT